MESSDDASSVAIEVVVDTGYGDQPPFLDGPEDRGLPYVVGVPSIARLRIAEEVDHYPGDGPPPPHQCACRPRGAKRLEDTLPGRDASSILEELEEDCWRVVPWRRGAKSVLRKLCVRVRVYRVGSPHSDVRASRRSDACY